MNDNSWNDAPAWAEYRATDADGRTFYYENKPVLNDREWIPTGGHVAEIKDQRDWRSTLEQRPDPLAVAKAFAEMESKND